MVTRADRSVLRFESYSKRVNKILCRKSEAPQCFPLFQRGGRSCLLFQQGVLTVEAAFCGTAFFLAFFALLCLFQLLLLQNKTEIALARAVAQYEIYNTKIGTIENLYENGDVLSWNDNEGLCSVQAGYTIPFLGSRIFHVRRYQQMRYSAYEGKSMVSQNAKSNEYVYITNYGRVYHKDASCVYLHPEIQSILYKNVADKRNASGGKYGICRSCCRNVELSEWDMVFLTPYGDCCHASKRCSKLLRTPRKVPLSDVGDMPGCSKCVE